MLPAPDHVSNALGAVVAVAIHYQTWNGSSWSAAQPISTANAQSPDIAIDLGQWTPLLETFTGDGEVLTWRMTTEEPARPKRDSFTGCRSGRDGSHWINMPHCHAGLPLLLAMAACFELPLAVDSDAQFLRLRRMNAQLSHEPATSPTIDGRLKKRMAWA